MIVHAEMTQLIFHFLAFADIQNSADQSRLPAKCAERGVNFGENNLAVAADQLYFVIFIDKFACEAVLHALLHFKEVIRVNNVMHRHAAAEFAELIAKQFCKARICVHNAIV